MTTVHAPTERRLPRRSAGGTAPELPTFTARAVPEPVTFTARAPAVRGRGHEMTAGLVATALWSLLWLGAWVAVPALVLGWQPVAITSGSMSPLIRAGDVVLLDPAATVETGSVITYPRGDGLETHRVVDVGDHGYVTRGDANAAPDRSPVAPDEVLGAGRLVVPLVGAPAQAAGFARSSAATWSAASASGADFATAELASATGFTATCVDSGRIDLGWTPSVTEAVTGYRLERRRKGEGSFSLLANVAGRTTSTYVDTATPFGGLTLQGTTTTTYRLTSVRSGTSWTSPSVQASATGNITLVLFFSCA